MKSLWDMCSLPIEKTDEYTSFQVRFLKKYGERPLELKAYEAYARGRFSTPSVFKNLYWLYSYNPQKEN